MGTTVYGDKYSNHLINEDSPYLRQHAHNPVDWYSWGNVAFKKAQKENKLIFLSIGYSTCHWCHVMERESFEDEEVARLLNDSFVSIKIDREEMPHIDKYYQDLYALLNKRGGGWPLTIVMTPETKAFFAATYIPADDKYGRAGMKKILLFLSNGYINEKEEILKSADSIEAAMKVYGTKKIEKKAELNIKLADKYVNNINTMFDMKYGGVGGTPKFPHATSFDVVLDIYGLTKNDMALKLSQKTLNAMAQGGIYDQIEGGFYRYSVDEKWMIPHFEKMLYTNAELLEVYAKAYMLTKEPLYKEIIDEIVTFVEKRFTKENLLYSASDADSDGEEGKYFVYTYEELMDAFENNKEAKEIAAYFNVTKSGNFEHSTSNPYITNGEKPKNLEKAKEVLRAVRAKRSYPFIDDKILTSWNALYINALFKAAGMDEKYKKKHLTIWMH